MHSATSLSRPATSYNNNNYHPVPLSPSPQPQPPTRASLKAWWHQFTNSQKPKKGIHTRHKEDHPVFGKPLQESLRYASVQISTADTHGRLYVWGYIPVVVAKCGLYLKENATEVEGTFRVSGSNKRMRDLQSAFETPPRYGKDLDWKQENYTTHDVASVFRRYLTQMPEPVIPWNMYSSFRDPLATEHHNQDEIINTYKSLIRRMPRSNQYLLLYVLDLLSVFARKSSKNLMTAANLAVTFQPGLISHPSHDLSPQEHVLSQRVLEFLIAQQDWFMLDISPPPLGGNGCRPTTPTSGGHNLVMISSKESEKDLTTDSWYHIGATDLNTHRVARRRTTMEHRTETRDQSTDGDLSPVAESPRSEKTTSTVGVSRSRTLPSSRRRGFTTTVVGNATTGNTTHVGMDGHTEKARVLRKQKRTAASSQPQPNRLGTKDQ
ncbi:hypothetical protein AX17_002302 [Amanita inopinata Kibby_2008]|nr:hypothetical protein AX17_002302 [Amanita inopinata Kibby_2008]